MDKEFIGIAKAIAKARERNTKVFLREAQTFKKLGELIGKRNTFDDKLLCAICYGLAEVCEGFAEKIRREGL